MATTSTAQYDQLANVATQAIQARVGDTGGKLRVLWFAHTCENEPALSTINLTIIPAGARVVDVVMSWGVLDSECYIGDSGTVYRLALITAVQTGSASPPVSVMRAADAEENMTLGFGYRYEQRTTITLTPAANLNTESFWGMIYYLID